MAQNTLRTAVRAAHPISHALNNSEFDLVQSFIERLFPAFQQRGFSFHVSGDFAEFVAIEGAGHNNTYDVGQDGYRDRLARFVLGL